MGAWSKNLKHEVNVPMVGISNLLLEIFLVLPAAKNEWTDITLIGTITEDSESGKIILKYHDNRFIPMSCANSKIVWSAKQHFEKEELFNDLGIRRYAN